MQISFDIDDTLVIHRPEAPLEPVRVPWVLRFLFRERVRLGASKLFEKLQSEGCRISIYTTSFRQSLYVKCWLRFYGARVQSVINERHHQKYVKPRYPDGQPPSKHPGLFGIDLHIDDSPGVEIEGKKHGFRVVVVDPTDLDWAEKVVLAVNSTKKQAASR